MHLVNEPQEQLQTLIDHHMIEEDILREQMPVAIYDANGPKDPPQILQ